MGSVCVVRVGNIDCVTYAECAGMVVREEWGHGRGSDKLDLCSGAMRGSFGNLWLGKLTRGLLTMGVWNGRFLE